MKRLVLAIIIFLIFALVGFQIAIRIDELLNRGLPTQTPSADSANSKHYNVVLIHVDRLDLPEPRLVSVWFISVYLFDGSPPALTIAQMYPTPGNTEVYDAFRRSFSLTRDGEPSAGFWRVVKTRKIEWNGYLLVDDFTVQKVMEWTNGPGEYPGLLGAVQNNPDQTHSDLMQMCRSLGGIANRNPAPFQLSDLAPDHFRSNLRMEEGITYWHKMTTTKQPMECDIVLDR